MRILMFIYLLTGYIIAFNYCRAQEIKGRNFSLGETGLIILLSCLLWLPLKIAYVYCEALLNIVIIVTYKAKKSTKK